MQEMPVCIREIVEQGILELRDARIVETPPSRAEAPPLGFSLVIGFQDLSFSLPGFEEVELSSAHAV